MCSRSGERGAVSLSPLLFESYLLVSVRCHVRCALDSSVDSRKAKGFLSAQTGLHRHRAAAPPMPHAPLRTHQTPSRRGSPLHLSTLTSERQLIDAHQPQSQLAHDGSEHPRDHRGRTARHHSRGSGKPSHRAWLLVAVVPATGTNGKCLEEVAVKMLKLDHHASEAASPISQRRPPR